MNFEECKKYLFEFYSINGFKKVVINNNTTWMLKNENINLQLLFFKFWKIALQI